MDRPSNSPRGLSPVRRPRRLGRTLGVAFVALALGACAPFGQHQRPVSIDSRPTPPQPSNDAAGGTPQPTGEVPTAGAESATRRIEADTLATHAVLERCAKRKLLPDQESTVDSVRQLLMDAHDAMAGGDLARAASLARQAHQLARSLSCP